METEATPNGVWINRAEYFFSLTELKRLVREVEALSDDG